MVALKQLTEPRSTTKYFLALWRTAYSLRPSGEAVAYFLSSFLLCPISFGYGAIPAAICLLCACKRNYISATTLGLLLGYGLFWGFAASFPLYAIAAVVLCARILLPKSTKRNLLLLICILANGLIGFLFVLGAHFSMASIFCWGIRLVSAAGATLLFQAAIQRGSVPARIGSGAMLLLGLYAIRLPLGFNLALIALGWIASAANGLICTCVGCAALAMLHPQATPYCIIFCLSCLCRRLLEQRAPGLRLIAVCTVYGLAGIRLKSYTLPICASIGAIAGLFLRPDPYLPVQKQASLPEQAAQRELRLAAQALIKAANMLSTPVSNQKRELAALFDSASIQVCQSCARQKRCWQDNSQTIYEDLTACGSMILSRGSAEAKDFPSRFWSQCLHPDAFLTAVNDALENARAGRRLRHRMDEARRVAKTQYEIIGTYLQRLSQQLYAPSIALNYSPEIAVQAAGRSEISGDRGAAFEGPNGTYYVLLCDGMGTGAEAARESTQAIGLLRHLLLSGLDAENALKALNGIYILRDNGCFSTVDLLRVNLTSGNAILYKWGASASYLKRHHGLRHLGGSSLPPGVAQNAEMEQIHFSLDHGCVIVLLSDGLGDQESQRRLESCESLYPKDVAMSLFVGRDKPDDDCTAVALRLHPITIKSPV